MSGYLKMDEQRKRKRQEAANIGLQKLFKGVKIEKELLLLELVQVHIHKNPRSGFIQWSLIFNPIQQTKRAHTNST